MLTLLGETERVFPRGEAERFFRRGEAERVFLRGEAELFFLFFVFPLLLLTSGTLAVQRLTCSWFLMTEPDPGFVIKCSPLLLTVNH